MPIKVDNTGGSSSLTIGSSVITGGTTGSVLFIGSGGVIQQDNTNFFWDDTNNFLGIGTASPGQKLTVSGTGTIYTQISSTDSNPAGVSFTTNSKNWLTYISSSDLYRIFSGTLGADAIRIDSAGNVGIGSNLSPSYKLDIATAAANDRAINVAVTSATGSNIGTRISMSGAATENDGLSINVSGATTNLAIAIAGPSSGANNYAIYSSATAQSYFAGYVGIGLTPAQQLDVANVIRITDTGNGNSLFQMTNTGTSVTYSLYNGQTVTNGFNGLGLYDGTAYRLVILNSGNVGIGTSAPVNLFVVGGNQSGNAGLEIVPGSGIVAQAYNRTSAAYSSLTFDGSTVSFRTSATSSVFNTFKAVTSISLAGATTGISLDLNTSVTPGAQSVTGQLITMPTVTVANTNTYKGLSITQGGLISTGAGASTWTGLDINMPPITQTAGTLTSTGIKITGGTVTSGTSYALITDSNAGNVGIGVASPSAFLHVIGTTEQVRIGYDTSNYYKTTVSSAGAVTFDAVGSGSAFTFSDPVTITNLTLPDQGQIKMTVPTTDLTATGPTNADFNCGYSSSAIGDLVYLDSSSTWQKCDANTLALYNGFLAIALQVKASGNALLVALPGSFIYSTTGFPTWTIGSPIYMSETAGAMTHTAPTTTDSATRVVGWGIHADKMYFNPSPDYYTHT